MCPRPFIPGRAIRHPASRFLCFVLCASAALLALGACSRSAGNAATGTRAGEQGPTPLQTLEELLAARTARQYGALTTRIVPEHASEVRSTLVAVDAFLSANRLVCDYVRDHVGLGLARSIDQSYVADILEVFSPFVELMDERVEGDVATISFVVDGRLPAKRATLRRVGGAWRYDPGPGYQPGLPKAFQRMARGLRQVLEEMQSGRLSPQMLREDPDRLMEEVRVRLMPGVRMLPAPDFEDRRKNG